MEPVISIRSVSKRYRLYENPQQRLRDALLPFGKHSHREFWALRDISFEVPRGQALGIIGRNGSGKSTLLQIVTGVLRPTAGDVTTHGRISALLELGAGFNPEYTGRNNVYFNLALAGFSRRDIDERFESIERFAEVGEFIDQPVKIYSTGLFLRLAFASAVSANPEILVVDEALSVGDVFFQQKCFAHIRKLIDGGTTLLFVSHDSAVIQNICDRAILLSQGEIAFEGSPEVCVSRYFAMQGTRSSAPEQDSEAAEAGKPRHVSITLKTEMQQNSILPGARSRIGHGGMEIAAATFQNEHGDFAMSIGMMETAIIRVLIRAHSFIASPATGLQLCDRLGNIVFAAGTRQLGIALDAMAAGDERVVSFKLRFCIQAGEYTLSLSCSEPSNQGPDIAFIHDRHDSMGPISVHYETTGVMPFYGVAQLPMSISVEGES